VWHHGIVRRIFFTGNGFAVEIAHNMKDGGIVASDWYEFSDGNLVHLERRASSAVHVREILTRVENSRGMPYHLFARNCEHFASFAFTGKPESKSVQTLGLIVAGLLFIGLIDSE
jgi:hypothetical protein